MSDRGCEALMFSSKSGSGKPEGGPCGDKLDTELFRGHQLCWVHRQVVLSGRATLEQVLKGERPPT